MMLISAENSFDLARYILLYSEKRLLISAKNTAGYGGSAPRPPKKKRNKFKKIEKKKQELFEWQERACPK